MLLKKVRKKNNFFLKIFFISFLFLFYSFVYGKQTNYYGIVVLKKSKLEGKVFAFNQQTLQTILLKENENVLPFGSYEITSSLKSYQDFKTNLILSKDDFRITVSIDYRLNPFTLNFKGLVRKSEFYFNKKYVTTFKSPQVTLSNIEGGKHRIFLKKGDLFYYKTIDSKGASTITIKDPVMNQLQYKALLASLMGMIPGCNLFLHLPQSSLEYLIPTSLLFYTGVFLKLSLNHMNVLLLSPYNDSIRDDAFNWMIILSSIFHVLFVYNGTVQDYKMIKKDYLPVNEQGLILSIKGLYYSYYF